MPDSTRSHRGLVAAMVLVLLAAGGGGWWWWHTRRNQLVNPLAHVAPPSPAQLRVLGRQLSARSAGTFAEALDPSVARALTDQHARALPRGSSVIISPRPLRHEGTLASVTAVVHVPRHRAQRWVLLLMYERPHWLVYATGPA